MNLQTEATQTGKVTQAQNLEVGQRILIAVDTKKVLSVTTQGGITYLTIEINGKKAYRTFRATRTFRTY